MVSTIKQFFFGAPLPDFVKVSRHDGTKSVDEKKFVQNEEVQKQIKEYAKDTKSS